jgi:monofunctional biosynthetic peptidoglycan transglycosylase
MRRTRRARRPKPNRAQPRRPRRPWLRAGLWAAGLGLALLLAWLALWPPVGRLATANPETTAFIQAQRQAWQEAGRDRRIRWRWTPLESISPYLRQAVLIAEDDKFHRHHGFDYDMMWRALTRNLESGSIKYGASTITQQLAKNLYLSPRRSLWRKLREAAIAWRLEEQLSKERILELYLNVVEWAPGVYGAEAAARHHFGRPASRLTPEQAARLAAVLPAPRRYQPGTNSGYVAQRWRRIYREMRRRGFGNIWR